MHHFLMDHPLLRNRSLKCPLLLIRNIYFGPNPTFLKSFLAFQLKHCFQFHFFFQLHSKLFNCERFFPTQNWSFQLPTRIFSIQRFFDKYFPTTRNIVNDRLKWAHSNQQSHVKIIIIEQNSLLSTEICQKYFHCI